MIKHTEVMKLALEALKSCDAAHITDGGRQWYDEKLVDKAVEAIEKALTSVPDGASEAKEQPAPATELREQEPVGEITAEDMGRPFNAIRIGTHFYKEVPPVGTKLYTSPPAQRTWVWLTDVEIASACKKHGGAEWWWRDIEEFAKAIEAKLKEKNA